MRAERTRFNTLEVINIIYKEFDPGSGRTLYVVEAMKYAQTLVREGLTVENSLFNTLDETKSYAKSKGIKKLVVVGSEITELDI